MLFKSITTTKALPKTELYNILRGGGGGTAVRAITSYFFAKQRKSPQASICIAATQTWVPNTTLGFKHPRSILVGEMPSGGLGIGKNMQRMDLG